MFITNFFPSIIKALYSAKTCFFMYFARVLLKHYVVLHKSITNFFRVLLKHFVVLHNVYNRFFWSIIKALCSATQRLERIFPSIIKALRSDTLCLYIFFKYHSYKTLHSISQRVFAEYYCYTTFITDFFSITKALRSATLHS